MNLLSTVRDRVTKWWWAGSSNDNSLLETGTIDNNVDSKLPQTKTDIIQALNNKQDVFSFLYDDFDNYKKDNWEAMTYSDTLDLAKKYFEQDESLHTGYIYRGMWLSIDSLRKIYNEGMHVNKCDDEDNDSICFTGQDKLYSSKTIERAVQEEQNQISVIFEVPLKLLRDYHIRFGWSWDKFAVDWDIPVDIIQKIKIFVVDYKTKDLIIIPLSN